jgi:HPt (histidine-containing phosphotransfer) domain-containing protein
MIPPTPAIDYAKLDALLELGGDRPFVDEVVACFLKDGAERVRTVRGAVASGDVALWTREAHSLKSASATVGADELRGVCLSIEQAGRAGGPPPAGSLDALDAAFDRARDGLAAWPDCASAG